MNWTGGTLQRTKHANKGVIQQQKAYFVRARTQLQNGSKLPVAPFRPSYLKNDDSFELAGHLPSFGPGSVRHTRHSARHRHDATHRRSSRDGGRNVLEDHIVDVSKDPSPEAFRGTDLATTQSRRGHRKSREKRKPIDADLETQLLEANKKRLLKQHDWIGVATSRPANLRFLSSEEKRKVGRRRKVEGDYGATARRAEYADFMKPRLQPTVDQYARAIVVGTVPKRPTGVRIRIGTDALTTACSTQPNCYNQSHASSDLMLFDEQTQDTERPDLPEATQPSVRSAHLQGHTSSQDYHVIKRKQARIMERGQRHFSPPHCINPDSPRNSPGACGPGNELASSVVANSIYMNNATASECSTGPRIMQQVEGDEHPLRLVFGHSNSSEIARARDASQNDDDLETEQALKTAHAGGPRMGLLHGLSSGFGLLSRSEAMAATSIVDEKPWMSLLDIPDKSSSHTMTSDKLRKSIMHDHPSMPYHEAESASWSQHATQGNQTYLSSSLISTSLPSLKRSTKSCERASTRNSEVGLECGDKTDSRVLNEDERLWQNFVFGSGDELESEPTHEHREESEHRPWKGSSSYLPLSLAVSSISSTPFSPLSGRASCDNVHDTARFAPSAGSRTISSPAAMPSGFIEELSDREDGDERTELGTFGEYSVTHASMLNNASRNSDSIPSRMFSYTETSCSGLEHSQRTTESMSERAPARSIGAERQSWRSSIHDIPESEEGLDLVDPDRLA